jgi:choline dehydrogenase-like flavoprotein
MIRDQITIQEHACEICIVGAGPVGLALALEFERLGRSVVVLESGSDQVSADLADISLATIADPKRHAPMALAACRAFGGTSWAWGGRCVAFDDIDFRERAYVPHSGWPLDHDEIRPWYARASEYLLCGDDEFASAAHRLGDLGSDVSASCLERWSTEPQLARVHRARIERSARIAVFLNTTVVGLDLGRQGRSVEKVLVHGPAGEAAIRAREVILAAGGIETTRLLLAIQQRHPTLFGGIDGPLGRFYMGHISGKIANIVFNNPEAVADLDFKLDGTRTYVRRRFTFSEAAQREHRLLNTCLFPDNPPFHDPRHGSSVLSAVFLALATPPVGRRILPEPIRLAHVGPKPGDYFAHMRNIALGAPRGLRDLLHVLHDKFFSRPRKPGFLLRNRDGRYALHYHAEQEPNPESRVVLSDEKDRFGLQWVAIDLRFTDGDAASVVRAHRVLDSALRAHAVGQLEYLYPENQLQSAAMAQASDGFHQVGTTRMGHDPKSSVVDSNLKTHDIDNLHVASSSVFPTTGQANSTYLAVALAVRLAHHLSGAAAGVTIPATEADQHASR